MARIFPGKGGQGGAFSHGEDEVLAALIAQLSSGSSGSTAALPPWLVAAVSGQQPASAKGGKPSFPGPQRDRPTPPWLAAAQGLPTAKLGAKGSGRQRVMANRIPGTLTDWNGTMGWVKPDEAIKHPDAAKSVKGLYLSKVDVVPEGHVLTKGMKVTCFAYSDGMKLGAERCMEFKGSLIGQDKSAEKRPWQGTLARAAESGSGKAKGKKSKDTWEGSVSPGFKGGQKGVWVYQPDVWDKRPSKGGGKQKQGKGWNSQRDERPRGNLPRTRVTEGIGVTGKCVEWKGTHGWIEPDVPVDHPKADKHKGKIHIHQKDIIEDLMLYTGQPVNFHIYEDASGLGAEECIAG